MSTSLEDNNGLTHRLRGHRWAALAVVAVLALVPALMDSEGVAATAAPVTATAATAGGAAAAACPKKPAKKKAAKKKVAKKPAAKKPTSKEAAKKKAAKKKAAKKKCATTSKPASPRPTPSTSAETNTSATAWIRGLDWYRTNTGVPAGTKLTPSGPINITKDGTVIDGLEVTGDITFSAANVTIRNTLVRGQIINVLPGRGAGGRYDNGYPGQNVLIEHVEVRAPANTRAIVSAWSTTMRYLKVQGGVQGTSFAGGNVIEDSYFFGLRTTNGSHAENIISNGNPDPNAGRTVIARNWLDATDSGARSATSTFVSGALCLYSDFGPITTVTITGNHMVGAGYLFRPGVRRGATGNLTVRNNTFARSGQFAWGAVYPSPLDAQTIAKWSGNKYTNGTVVTAPR